MKVRAVPLVAAAMAFLALSLSAQKSLPYSYLEKLTTIDHLQKLTFTELANLTLHAERGVPDAQYKLALVYEAGRIVPRDKATARHWLLKAAEQEFLPAETDLGLMDLPEHSTGELTNYGDAGRWLRAAAMQGDAEAQLWLGIAYDRGYFGSIDYRESLKWLEKSAAQGLPDAQFALARMYGDGHGVPQSDEEAAAWFRQAADHYSDVSGVFEAKVELAYMYRDGRLKKNNAEAYMWFAILGAEINPPADEDVEELSKSMTQPEIQEAQARVAKWTADHPLRPR